MVEVKTTKTNEDLAKMKPVAAMLLERKYKQDSSNMHTNARAAEANGVTEFLAKKRPVEARFPKDEITRLRRRHRSSSGNKTPQHKQIYRWLKKGKQPRTRRNGSVRELRN
jgi:hypothetical protein